MVAYHVIKYEYCIRLPDVLTSYTTCLVSATQQQKPVNNICNYVFVMSFVFAYDTK